MADLLTVVVLRNLVTANRLVDLRKEAVDVVVAVIAVIAVAEAVMAEVATVEVLAVEAVTAEVLVVEAVDEEEVVTVVVDLVAVAVAAAVVVLVALINHSINHLTARRGKIKRLPSTTKLYKIV